MLAFFSVQRPSGPLKSEALYGLPGRLRQALAAMLILLACLPPSVAAAKPVKIVCLGDSLTAGYGLPPDAAFPFVLDKALKDGGLQVEVSNAGVSGDTTTGGLERLDWAVPEGTDVVILELGANDMLFGLDPGIPQQNLVAIIKRLQARHIRILLAGMYSTRNYGLAFKQRFDAIYPALAEQYKLPLYPFFLEGVTDVPGMTLPDGLHPTRAGVEVIVKGILPMVREAVK